MAKTTAPTLSFEARGSIAKTLVYSSWRGVRYARRHVVPANPRTVAQQAVRTLFAFLREIYKLSPSTLTNPWNAFAQGRPFTGMNKFVGENVRVMNGEADLNNFIFSPGAKGGLPPVDIVVTSPVATECSIAITLPTLPDGWAMAGAYGVALLQQDPTGIFEGGVHVGEDIAAPMDTVVITGLTTGEEYQVGCFLKQTKPDGTYAYSVSLSDIIVVS
jgi:hypothetical protein